jgi:hypothetical protein
MTQDEVEIVERGLRSVVNTYGRLVAKDSDGRVVDSGSAVFVQIDGQKLLATAHHVVCGLFAKGEVYVEVFRDWAQVSGVPSPPIEHRIGPEAILDVQNAALFDVSALRPPCAMEQETSIKWFALDRHAAALREHLRPMIERQRDPRLAGVILGFARFSRFEDAALRVQAAGSIPIWAILERISDPPSIASGTVPQVIVELDPTQVTGLPADAPPLIVACFEQFWSMVRADEHALGGYSGGPLMYFCDQGPFLVGIAKEAGMGSGGQGFATPIDVFVQCVCDAPNSPETGHS